MQSNKCCLRLGLTLILVQIFLLTNGILLAQDDWGDEDWDDDIVLPEIHGFVELAAGARLGDSPAADDGILLS